MSETPPRVLPLMAGQTDRGRVRDHNEDVVLTREAMSLAVLADGMGGYNAGEVAARIAADVIADGMAAAIAAYTGTLHDVDPATGLMRATLLLSDQIQFANEAIYESALNDPECEGMGTTVVTMMVCGSRIVVAHVGDSRCYRWRNGMLDMLTRDHSLLQEQIDSGQWQADKAREFPRKNLVTRALGAEQSVQVDVAEHAAQANDVYLLCSDGLTDMLEDPKIWELLKSVEPGLALEKQVSRLIDAANQRGGRDNVSAVLVQIPEAYMVSAQPAVIRKRKAA